LVAAGAAPNIQRVRRRSLMALIAGIAAVPGTAARARTDPAARRRELDAWWDRQREKEAADRFWNGPREQRRNLTRDQIERWEEQRGYRGLGPSGLAGPNGPYGRFHRRLW
jgi:hypothetical protein